MSKSTIKKSSLVILTAIFLGGCATNLPMTSSLNDFVMMGTKINSSENVLFQYESNVTDGLVKPFDRDKVKEVSGHPGFNHTQSATLGRMLNEFMGNKFAKLSPSGTTTIKATLKDFWVEQYSTDSGASQALAVFAGGEINMMCVAKVKVLLTVNRNGEEMTKIISITSEDTFVSGIGTGTSTSNIHRGKDSIQHTHARNINKANNKVIMMMNSYFEELGL